MVLQPQKGHTSITYWYVKHNERIAAWYLYPDIPLASFVHDITWSAPQSHQASSAHTTSLLYQYTPLYLNVLVLQSTVNMNNYTLKRNYADYEVMCVILIATKKY